MASISASCTPSPRSGNRNDVVIGAPLLTDKGAPRRCQYALHPGKIAFFPAEIGDDKIKAGDPLDRRLKEVKSAFHQRLADALKRAGEESGERLWQLPIWEEYGENMKSDIADLKNSGSRDAGALKAGWFLKQFVGSAHWAHLDIAGTAWSDKARPYCPKGATGVGVRLLIEYLRGK